jgi:hypothetical protein
MSGNKNKLNRDSGRRFFEKEKRIYLPGWCNAEQNVFLGTSRGYVGLFFWVGRRFFFFFFKEKKRIYFWPSVWRGVVLARSPSTA